MIPLRKFPSDLMMEHSFFLFDHIELARINLFVGIFSTDRN